MLDDLDLSSIQDEPTWQCIILPLNLVEDLKQENRALREEIQRLRDENDNGSRKLDHRISQLLS
jgi:hypothetical protein